MDMEYLKPGFDPNNLKVAQLRRILTEQDVEFPPQSKKTTLVQLFQEKVEPQIPKLRKQFENTSPSDKDIVNVAIINKKKKKPRKEKSTKAKLDASSKVKKEKSRSSGSSRLSGSEILGLDGDVSASTEVDVHLSGSENMDVKLEKTPFSEVNDFQQGSMAKRKRNKRKGTDLAVEEEAIKDAEGDLNMKESSDQSSDDEIPAKTRKRRRKIGEGGNTPITERVAQKTPQKSPHRSLIIDKFETSSSSDSSFNGTPVLLVSHREHSGVNELENRSEDMADKSSDFSYRRTLTPDLSKLKVSAAFGEELKTAFKENSVPALARLESHSDQEKEYISGPARIGMEKNTSISDKDDTETLEGRKEFSESSSVSSQATIAKTDKESTSPTPESISEAVMRVNTPELPSEQNVIESNDRVRQMQDSLNDIDEQTRKDHAKATLNIRPYFKSFGVIMYRLCLFFLVVIPFLYGLWYREQRILIGYCGQEIQSRPLFDDVSSSPILRRIDQYLQETKPSCLPCPDHAICYPNMKIKCRPEYSLQENHWSLFGLIPLGDSCVKDSRKEKLISEVVKKSLEFLRTKNAQFSCGEGTDDLKSGMTEDELYQIFYESRAPWINDSEFDELWAQAVSDLKDEPEITWRQVSNKAFHSFDNLCETPFTNNIYLIQVPNNRSTDFDGPSDNSESDGFQRKKGHISEAGRPETTRIFRSTSKKYIGLRCKFEREIYQTYHRFSYLIWIIFLATILVKFISYKLKTYYRQREVVEQISKKVILKLKTIKKQRQSPGFLSAVQLRDVLLADVTDLKSRNTMWQKVVKVLENSNTNVKSSLTEIHGEIMKCWEWVGPLDDEPISQNNAHPLEHT